MKIALDYDGTFDRDPELWREFIGLCWNRGIDIRIVTSRPDSPSVRVDAPIPVIYTYSVPKRKYCREVAQWVPDVWIDNIPEAI